MNNNNLVHAFVNNIVFYQTFWSTIILKFYFLFTGTVPFQSWNIRLSYRMFPKLYTWGWFFQLVFMTSLILETQSQRKRTIASIRACRLFTTPDHGIVNNRKLYGLRIGYAQLECLQFIRYTNNTFDVDALFSVITLAAPNLYSYHNRVIQSFFYSS